MFLQLSRAPQPTSPGHPAPVPNLPVVVGGYPVSPSLVVAGSRTVHPVRPGTQSQSLDTVEGLPQGYSTTKRRFLPCPGPPAAHKAAAEYSARTSLWGQRFTDHGDAGRANQFRAIPEPNFDDVHDSTARTNTAGAFTGGGVGNKAIFGVFGHHQQPIGALESISFTWRNVVGPGGPFYNPPTAGTVLTPYVNLIVDFNPLVPGNLHVVVLLSDSLSPSITQSIGSYANPAGANELTYSWSKSQNVLLANTAPNAAPGGVTPQVTVGPQWLDNSFRWADLVAINPQAVLVDAFPNDGGLPAGAVLPAILLVSGDSGNVSRSGKKILRFLVNGTSVL